jgi:hypothetical protein
MAPVDAHRSTMCSCHSYFTQSRTPMTAMYPWGNDDGTFIRPRTPKYLHRLQRQGVVTVRRIAQPQCRAGRVYTTA